MTFMHYFAYQMARVIGEEKRQMREKTQVVHGETDSPYSYLEGYNIKGQKRKVKDPTLGLPSVKAQRMEKLPSPFTNIVSPTTGRRTLKRYLKVRLSHLLIHYEVTLILTLSNSRVLVSSFPKSSFGTTRLSNQNRAL